MKSPETKRVIVRAFMQSVLFAVVRTLRAGMLALAVTRSKPGESEAASGQKRSVELLGKTRRAQSWRLQFFPSG